MAKFRKDLLKELGPKSKKPVSVVEIELGKPEGAEMEDEEEGMASEASLEGISDDLLLQEVLKRGLEGQLAEMGNSESGEDDDSVMYT